LQNGDPSPPWHEVPHRARFRRPAARRVSLHTTAPAAATMAGRSATGQAAYAGTSTVGAGAQEFSRDGRGNDGIRWPDGRT
jgi:hypothetical protein